MQKLDRETLFGTLIFRQWMLVKTSLGGTYLYLVCPQQGRFAFLEFR